MAARFATLTRTAAVWLALAPAAWAQTVTLSVNLPDQLVSIDECATEVERSFTASGTYNGTPVGTTYEMWLTINTSNDVCNDSMDSCDNEAGSDCQCLDMVEGNSSVSADSQRISQYYDADTLCAYGTATTLYFFAEYYQAAQGVTQEVSYNSDAFTVLFDNERPGHSSEAPTLTAADNAFEVSFSGISGADRYEVCARPILESPTPDADQANNPAAAEGVSNDDLRGAYRDGVCQTFSGTSGRLDGLQNDVTYFVVYAAFDEAGNRGGNSPSAAGTPVQVQDFAEYYSQICRGPEPEEGRDAWAGRPCEDGGCRAAGAQPGALALLLFALIGLLARRRRNA
ncbi:MAG: hypothetical protein KC613_00500 [Myxococcales bacterium]|nr:hypothetical protein [Myxococcales bacterium]MCB9526221.1 hypothetical protein [Myxococcales bacterium]